MDVDDYLNEDEEADNSSFNGEDAVKSETLAEGDKDVCEQSLQDYEATEEKESYSDGWLYEDTLVDEGDFCSPPTVADQQNESSNEESGTKVDGAIGQSGPHVKTSAIMGVGLQELLELIDEKLSAQDEKLKAAKVVERSIFERKWRPSHTQQDSSIAAEQ